MIILLIVLSFIYLKFALPRVADAPDLAIEPTQERLIRGEHLVNNVMGCVDCHSQKDFTFLAPNSIPGTEGAGGEKWTHAFNFPGTMYSPNITPYNLGSWTDGEVYRTITSGVTIDGDALFPIMPYHSFGQLDDNDLYAVIAYVRTLPSIKSDFPKRELDFPVSLLVNTMPAGPTKKLPPPNPSDAVAFGRYLATAAACTDCHTRQVKGKPVENEYLAGGFEFPLPTGITVTSANITSDSITGIGAWTEEEFIDRFLAYRDMPVTKVPKGEFNTIMPWRAFSGMSHEELSAIYAYLKTVPSVDKKIPEYHLTH